MTSGNMESSNNALFESHKRRLLVSGAVRAIETGQNDELISALQKRMLLTQEETERILASSEDMPYMTLEAVINHGWDINEPIGGPTPPYLSQVLHNKTAVNWFLDHGADVNAYAEPHRCTPLSWAVKYASLDMVQLLFEHGGMADRGELVNFAVARRNADPLKIPMLEFVLSKGAPPDHVLYEQFPHLQDLTMFHIPPLSSCSGTGNVEAVQLLIQYGADLWKTAPLDDRLAIDIARQNGHEDIVDILQRAMQASARL